MGFNFNNWLKAYIFFIFFLNVTFLIDYLFNILFRRETIDAFQSQGPHTPQILLLSLKAGGVGLNLTAANHLLLMDPAWNPAAEWQCFDRIHRMGQTKDVFIYKFITIVSSYIFNRYLYFFSFRNNKKYQSLLIVFKANRNYDSFRTSRLKRRCFRFSPGRRISSTEPSTCQMMNAADRGLMRS